PPAADATPFSTRTRRSPASRGSTARPISRATAARRRRSSIGRSLDPTRCTDTSRRAGTPRSCARSSSRRTHCAGSTRRPGDGSSRSASGRHDGLSMTLTSSRSLVAAAIVAALAGGSIDAVQKRSLDIYVVDVEGGNATLVAAPSGESLLIDTGNLNGAARDADRIMVAVRDAGLRQIDHLIVTHWHADHFGGVAELAARIPIRHFIDHGANVQPNPTVDEFLKTTYPQLYGRSTHTVAKAGDTIDMAGLDVRVVSSAGQVVAAPLPGAGGSNPY